jgi:hypothetical protein
VGAWRILAGASLSAAAQLSLGGIVCGMQSLVRWLRALRDVGGVLPWLEPRPYQTHSLRTFWSMLIPWPRTAFAFYLVSGIAVLGMTILCWKRTASTPLALRFSALLIATVLIAPHLTVYDLVILAPAFLLSADWLLAQAAGSGGTSLGSALYSIYLLPLAGPLALWTHVQLSVIAMVAALVLIWRLSDQIDQVQQPLHSPL